MKENKVLDVDNTIIKEFIDDIYVYKRQEQYQ